uniref:Uncharacterized protein n=1 Tax=Solanum tuberosum TaxID=4113 RepID=M1A286_SOLTU
MNICFFLAIEFNRTECCCGRRKSCYIDFYCNNCTLENVQIAMDVLPLQPHSYNNLPTLLFVASFCL